LIRHSKLLKALGQQFPDDFNCDWAFQKTVLNLRVSFTADSDE
jgi:hypothetical protein